LVLQKRNFSNFWIHQNEELKYPNNHAVEEQVFSRVVDLEMTHNEVVLSLHSLKSVTESRSHYLQKKYVWSNPKLLIVIDRRILSTLQSKWLLQNRKIFKLLKCKRLNNLKKKKSVVQDPKQTKFQETVSWINESLKSRHLCTVYLKLMVELLKKGKEQPLKMLKCY